MIVVSDTGPLNYLIRLDVITVLPKLYGSVVIPEMVRQEMSHAGSPAPVRAWAAQLPDWVSVGQTQSLLPLTLDAGELAAISLAVAIGADLILMDDLHGRRAAASQNLKTTGTLGILAEAAAAGMLDLADALTRLQQMGFYVSETLVRTLLSSQTTEQK